MDLLPGAILHKMLSTSGFFMLIATKSVPHLLLDKMNQCGHNLAFKKAYSCDFLEMIL